MQATAHVGYRLSPQQKQLWVKLAKEKRHNAFRADCAILIEGLIDEEVLISALVELVRQSEILHTSFHVSPGAILPLQIIGPPQICWQGSKDLTHLEGAEQKRQVEWLLASSWAEDSYSLR